MSAGDPHMNTPQVRKGVKHFMHSEYKEKTDDLTHDIGLIKVDKLFTREIYQGQKYQINPVCLPEKRIGLNWKYSEPLLSDLIGYGIDIFRKTF